MVNIYKDNMKLSFGWVITEYNFQSMSSADGV